MRVEYEFVGREEEATIRALDAFRARRIVAGWQELAATSPGALVEHAERKVFG